MAEWSKAPDSRQVALLSSREYTWEFWSSYEGRGSNPLPDKIFLSWNKLNFILKIKDRTYVYNTLSAYILLSVYINSFVQVLHSNSTNQQPSKKNNCWIVKDSELNRTLTSCLLRKEGIFRGKYPLAFYVIFSHHTVFKLTFLPPSTYMRIITHALYWKSIYIYTVCRDGIFTNNYWKALRTAWATSSRYT